MRLDLPIGEPDRAIVSNCQEVGIRAREFVKGGRWIQVIDSYHLEKYWYAERVESRATADHHLENQFVTGNLRWAQGMPATHWRTRRIHPYYEAKLGRSTQSEYFSLDLKELKRPKTQVSLKRSQTDGRKSSCPYFYSLRIWRQTSWTKG